jgi:hypothetical protein
MSDTFLELRKFTADGNEPFMTGHQIRKMRAGCRRTPRWALDNDKVQELLLRSFPKMKVKGHNHRRRAARWMAVIQLFFRCHMTLSHVAETLGLSEATIQNIVHRLHLAARNERPAYKSTGRPRGRPRKKNTPNGSDGFRPVTEVAQSPTDNIQK